jgi:hypothetical protein
MMTKTVRLSSKRMTMRKPENPLLTREVLEQYSPEELADLIALAEETEKYARPFGAYEPHEKQLPVHKSQAFIRALFPGNGFGKTTACINEALWSALGTHPYRDTGKIPNTTIIVIDDPGKADTVYLTEIKKKKWYDVTKLKLEKHGRPFTTEVIFPNGSNWQFMSHEVLEAKWESIQCAGVIFDEPPPRFIFIALIRGMREQGTKPWMMFAGTPIGKNAPWMYREIWRPWKFGEDPEIECFTGTTYDNLHNLEPGSIERMKKRYNEKELKARIGGTFEFLSGRIFDTFYHDHHVEQDFDWPWSWPVILAMDPHVRKNHVAVLIGIDPDKEIHVIRELETSLAGRNAAEFFIRACEGYNIKWGICDNYGSMPHTGGENRKSFIDVFNETSRRLNSRVFIRATTKAEKADDEWIEDMKDWLRLEADSGGSERPRFHIFESCKKTIDEFETYIWDEYRGAQADGRDVKEKPLGTNCDRLMCIKYGIALKPDRLGEDRIYRRTKRVGHGAEEYESTGKDWLKD